MAGLPAFAPAIEPMILAFGTGIADAQRRLDFVSLRIARAMGGLDPEAFYPPGEGPGAGEAPAPAFTGPSGRSYNLLELGLSPTFYRFAHAVLELRMAVSMSEEVKRTRPTALELKVSLKTARSGFGVRVSAITGTYSSRYQYSGESSARLRSRLESVPAPALLETRLAAMARDRAGAGAT